MIQVPAAGASAIAWDSAIIQGTNTGLTSESGQLAKPSELMNSTIVISVAEPLNRAIPIGILFRLNRRLSHVG
jgi:hypothetical protein